MSKNDIALSKALATLREVTLVLSQGIRKEEFDKKFHNRYVSPGVSVRRHVEELRINGSLNETDTQIQLKPKQAAIAA